MKNEAPNYENIDHVRTESNEDTINHIYESRLTQDCCPNCGEVERFRFRGRTSSALTDLPKEGRRVLLTVFKPHYFCLECREPHTMINPIPSFGTFTIEMQQYAVASPLCDADLALDMLVAETTIRSFLKGIRPRRNKVRREGAKTPKFQDQLWPRMKAILSQGAISQFELVRRLDAEGFQSPLVMLNNMVSEYGHVVRHGKGNESIVSLTAYLQWPATGPAPKTMLGKCRAEQPALRRELMGYNMECAA